VRESDLPILFVHQSDPEANRVAVFPARDEVAFNAHWERILKDPDVLLRTILYEGEVAGSIVMWEYSGKLLIGYWIDRNLWGRGVATAALTEFLRLVPSRPLHAYVAEANAASIRVLQKCGFTACGHSTHGGVEELLMQLG
jgi:RimJ/RimL family protein N-acetyltransferase